MVSAKIHDWLDKCIQFAQNIASMYHATGISPERIEELLACAWPRLLITYMMEHSFDFCVARVSPQEHSHLKDCVDERERRREALSMPRKRDATHLLQLIAKGHSLSLSSEAYDYIREIILFKESKDDDSRCHVASLNAHKRLEMSCQQFTT